ncbi:MAG: S1/P1 nuclease [Verrucomicrobia bacterium]|nr:S1/P1 nuclease [Verrucomicrobiota bacterium]
MILRLLLPTVIVVLTCSRAFAWGQEGHRTIAALALEHLQKSNPAAAAKVKEILGNESVEDASIWPDDVRPNRIPSRSGRFANTDEGKAFNTAHPDNPAWHFVDLPLGSKAYGDKRFTKENDVVQTLVKCIDVLEGRSEFMSKHDALRFLLHMGGDVHQPLHAACGFFKFDAEGRATLISDPDEAAANMDGADSGGNKLLLGSESGATNKSPEEADKRLPLHRYWDEHVVAMNAETEAELAVKLRDRVAAFKPTNTGEVRTWPAQWATDSIGVSREIYAELKYGKRFPRTGNYWTIYLNFQKGTKEKFTDMAAVQLVKATRNLAETLGAIQWK